MSTVRASRKFMHSTSSPDASFCFIALAIGPPSLSPRPSPRASGERVRGLSSAAGDGVDVADAFGQSRLVPAAAAVLRAEHLAKARDAVDLVRVARMHGDAHHRRLGLDTV